MSNLNYFEKQIPLSFSSDIADTNIVTYKSVDGSSFTTRIPLVKVPLDAKNIRIYLKSMRYWYTFQNISVSKGNNQFYVTNDVSLSMKYTLTIPDGIYSVNSLSATIQNELVNHGLASNVVSIVGDTSNGQCFFTIASGWQLYFPSTTPYVLLGCTLNQKIPSGGLTTAQYGEYAPNDAQFSQFSAINLHCSLVSNSIVNGEQSNILDVIIPDVSVGFQAKYEPINLLKINADNLRGRDIYNVTLNITDQNNVALETDSNSWGCTLVIEYFMAE